MKTIVKTLLVAVLVAYGRAPAASQSDLQDVRMTIPVQALVFYPIYAAMDRGFLEAEGLKLELISTQGDGPDVDALIAGSVDFTVSTPNRLLTAYQQGRPLKGIMSVSNRMGTFCYMNKAVADERGLLPDMPVDDKLSLLKGLIIGGTRPGSISYLLGIHYAVRAGLVPQKDVKVIGVGAGQALMAATENGKVDLACFASPGVEQAEARGKSVIFINNPRGEDSRFEEFLFEVLYVRPEYAEENPETVRKMTSALVNAIGWIKSASDEEHLTLLNTRFPGVDKEVMLAAVHNTVSAMSDTGEVTPRALQSAVDFLASVDFLKGKIPFGAVIDNGFLPSAK